MWADKGKGALLQFGDGAALITDTVTDDSILVGLGEFKAAFDERLLQQLFERSLARAHLLDVSFIDAMNVEQSRTLVSHLSSEGKALQLRW